MYKFLDFKPMVNRRHFDKKNESLKNEYKNEKWIIKRYFQISKGPLLEDWNKTVQFLMSETIGPMA